jgi:hypothetical protein
MVDKKNGFLDKNLRSRETEKKRIYIMDTLIGG